MACPLVAVERGTLRHGRNKVEGLLKESLPSGRQGIAVVDRRAAIKPCPWTGREIGL